MDEGRRGEQREEREGERGRGRERERERETSWHSLNSQAPGQERLTEVETLIWVRLGTQAKVDTYLGVNLGFTFY